MDARDGEPFVFTDVHPGGAGARPDHDGPALIFVGDGDTRNTPVEVIETRYPIRVERHELLPELRWRGSLARWSRASPATSGSSSPASRCSTRWRTRSDPLAKGLEGGEDGIPGVLVINPGTDREVVLTDRVTAFGPLDVGDVLSARSGGGGGYGAEPLAGDGSG